MEIAGVHDRELKWSRAEKIVARKAFEGVLGREFERVIRKVKEMASRIEQPSELWDLEYYLSQRHKEIDRKYDYRYSQLPMVFGLLIREGKMKVQELEGLREDKLEHIRKWAKLHKE
jgi:Photoprotection regulator fluorescence recovery protein